MQTEELCERPSKLTTFFACQGTWHPLSGLRMYVSVLSLITRSWMWLGRIKARGKNLYSAGNILVAQAFADYIELKNSRCEKKLSTKSSLEKLTYRRMFERCRARDFLRQI